MPGSVLLITLLAPIFLDCTCMYLVAVPAGANRRESTGSQNIGQTAPGASNAGNSAQPGSGSPGTRESEVRVVPIRTLVAAVPAPGGRAISDPSRGTMGMILPVFARVQRVTSGISGSARGGLASDQPRAGAVDHGSQSIPNSTVEHENVDVVGVDGSSNSLGEVADGSGYTSQFAGRLEQLLRGMFAGDHLHEDGGNMQGTEAGAVTGHVGTTQNGDNSDAAAAAAASDEGTFLSNVLRQIMPIIYENGGSGTNNTSTEAEENGSRASSSRRQDDSSEEPDPKRQKRE